MSNGARSDRALTGFLLLALLLAAHSTAAQEPAPRTRVAPGETVSGEISAQQPRGFEIELEAGERVRGAVQQHGINLLLVILSPDGSPIAILDSPNGADGAERGDPTVPPGPPAPVARPDPPAPPDQPDPKAHRASRASPVMTARMEPTASTEPTESMARTGRTGRTAWTPPSTASRSRTGPASR